MTPHVWFTEHDWITTTDRGGLVKTLDWPMYVKPANMGSSIGISRVTSMAELHTAVELAFGYDRVLVVEQGVVARELTCGVLGDHDTPDASVAVELNIRGDWLDYEGKYLSDHEIATVPAALPEPIAEEVREMSLRAYRAIGGYGLARSISSTRSTRAACTCWRSTPCPASPLARSMPEVGRPAGFRTRIC